MEDNERNIRLVTDNGAKYTAGEYTAPTESRREAFEHKVSYQKRQKERRMKKKRRRAALVLFLVIVLILALLFLTPVFNIRRLSVEGNSIVPEEQIAELLKPLIGDNLLRTGSEEITKTLKAIPYIDKVYVQKRMFPPSVDITVTEYTEAALIRKEGKTLIVNHGLHVLSEDGEGVYGLPVITGVEVKDYGIGTDLTLNNDEKAAALAALLSALEESGLLSKVIEIDITNLTYITMNYDDRIDVKCGSSLDIDRKISLLAEAVMSNSLSENSKGTIDLSETGKAVYTP